MKYGGIEIMINQYISRELSEELHFKTQQQIWVMLSKLKDEELVEIYLGSCTYSDMQRIFIPTLAKKTSAEICIKVAPVDEVLVAYQFIDNEGMTSQIICKKSEAEDLVKFVDFNKDFFN